MEREKVINSLIKRNKKRRIETAQRFESELTERQITFFNNNPLVQTFLKTYSDYISEGKGSAIIIWGLIQANRNKDSFWLYIDEMTFRRMEEKNKSK